VYRNLTGFSFVVLYCRVKMTGKQRSSILEKCDEQVKTQQR
jgi:hypothetical protein